MTMELKEAIDDYIGGSFTPEMQGELRASMMVFDAFEYTKPEEDLADVIYDIESDNIDLTLGRFLSVVDLHLNALLGKHRVKLLDETDFSTKNQFLAALYRLQHLEDPVPVLRVLETTSLTGEEQLARIINQLTVLSEADVVACLESVDPSTLQLLQEYLYTQEENLKSSDLAETKTEQMKKQLLDNLKDYFTVCGTDNIGYELIENGVLLAHPVALYYPYVSDHLVTPNDEQTAKNLLSFFFYASDTYNTPLETYRTYSEQLIPGHNRIMAIETIMGRLLNELRQYQKAHRDARQLSPTHHQAQAL